MYALLNHLSPSYPSSFQHALADKLENLNQRQNPRSTVDNGSLEVRMSTVLAWGVVVLCFYQSTAYPFSLCPFIFITPTQPADRDC